jgi:hypothetical protein
MMSTHIVQICEHLHLQHSDLQSNWYTLSSGEIGANFQQISPVVISDCTNIGQIANLKAGGETAAETSQSVCW